jgi:hypothetical protein
MRRLLTGFVVAATTALVPMLALAGNQEVAEQIAKGLRNSDRMCDYKIGVKYQDGTAWLRGHVTSPEQVSTALKLVYQTPGVTRVVNELTVASGVAAPAAQPDSCQNALPDTDVTPSAFNPLRGREDAPTAAQAPRPKLGLVKRLGAALSGSSEPQPLREEAPDRVERVPSSFAPLPVEAVSDEEPLAEPQPVVPQRARPIAKTSRAPQQVAMNQPTRGPVAPNGGPMPMYTAASAAGVAPARYDQPNLPNYAWP